MSVTFPSERALVVAKKDFFDAARSKLLIALGIFFVVLEALAALVESKLLIPLLSGEAAEAAEVTRSIAGHSVMFVAFVGVLIAYRSIAGERTSGSIKFLMSVPNSRADVVVGKVLGRWTVLSIPLVVGFTLGTVIGWIAVGGVDIGAYGIGLLGLLAFSLTYISIVVALSASMRSPMRVVAVAVFIFVFFQFMWDLIPTVVYLGVEYAKQGDSLEASMILTQDWPSWTFLFDVISPTSAFDATINLMTGREISPPQHPVAAVVATFLSGLVGDSGVEDSWYVTNWMGPISLFCWTVLSIGLGYLRFETTDL